MHQESSVSQNAQLVLLPGLICNETVWAPQVGALRDYRPMAIHGYGSARSLEAMARMTLASAPARFSLAGHSMGGRVALEMYRQAPDRIERLALLDTGVHAIQPGEREKRLAVFEVGKTQGMAALVANWLPPMVHTDRRDDPELMRELTDMCLSAGLEQFENQITALINRHEAHSLLARISCPTLVGVGSDDIWAPVQQHREIAAVIPDAEMVIFEHAGHMAPRETPELVSKALRRWLERPLVQT